MLLKARLKINEGIIPIQSFNHLLPEGALGGSLTVALSKPDTSQIPFNSKVTLEIGVKDKNNPGSDYVYVPLLNEGNLAGRSSIVKWIPDEKGGIPGDVVEFDALNTFANRWTLAPEKPIIIYDPEKINGAALTPPDSTLIRRKGGIGFNTVQYLRPLLEAKENLDLYQLLNRAYGKEPISAPGCGFDRVITNIANYPVSKHTITIEGGYHDSIKSLYALFNPVVYDYQNELYIIDAEKPLPFGYTPKILNLKCIVEANEVSEPTEIVNRVILSYKKPSTATWVGYIPNGTFIQEPPVEQGSGVNYTRTETLRRVTQYKEIGTGEIIGEEEVYVEISTYGYNPLIGDIDLISKERIDNIYTGKVKTSHTRYIDALIENPNAGSPQIGFERILTEYGTYDWIADLNNEGEFILKRSDIVTSGLVLVEVETDTNNQTYNIYTPILDAVNNSLIRFDGSQFTEDRPYRKITEELRELGGNQTAIETKVFNLITGRMEDSAIQTRTGSRSTYSPSKKNASPGLILEEIVNQDSIDLYGYRKAIRLDIGELSPVEGRKIVERILKRSGSPPRKYTITFPGVDLSIRRGSIVRVPTRSGFAGDYIITGLTITGRALGTPNQFINMQAQAIRLATE